MKDRTVLSLHIQPMARHSELSGWHGDAIKIRLSAQPVTGAANAALIAFLAERIGVPREAVRIVAGHRSRRKRVMVTGLQRPEVLRRLGLTESG